jgi:hypothetical protein
MPDQLRCPGIFNVQSCTTLAHAEMSVRLPQLPDFPLVAGAYLSRLYNCL